MSKARVEFSLALGNVRAIRRTPLFTPGLLWLDSRRQSLIPERGGERTRRTPMVRTSGSNAISAVIRKRLFPLLEIPTLKDFDKCRKISF